MTNKATMDEFREGWGEMAENLGSSVTSGDMRYWTEAFIQRTLFTQKQDLKANFKKIMEGMKGTEISDDFHEVERRTEKNQILNNVIQALEEL